MKLKNAAIALALAGMATGAQAADFKFSGFGTAGFTSHGEEGAVVNSVGKKGDWIDQSVLGIQMDAGLTDQLSLTSQVRLAEDGGTRNTLSGSVQTLFLAYQPSDDMMVRVGRLRAPFYLQSEFMDVGYLRTTATNPVAVYSQAPFQNYNGVDMIYSIWDGDNEIQVQPYVGKETFEYIAPAGPSLVTMNIDTNYLAGVNVSYIADEWKVRAGYTIGEMNNQAPIFPVAMDVNNDSGSFMTIGGQYDDGELFLASEFAQRSVDDALGIADLQGAYATAGYRMGRIMPYVTMQSLQTGDKNKEIGVNADFTSTGIGARYDIKGVSMKLEANQFNYGENGMFGYANLNTDNNPALDSATQVTFTIDTTF